MKKLSILASVVGLIFLAGCGAKTTSVSTITLPTSSIGSVSTTKTIPVSIEGISSDSENYVYGTQKSYIVTPKQGKASLKMYLESGDKLNTLIKPTDTSSKAVLRLSTITGPDGTDGPFGPENDYEVKKSGDYELVFGINLMATNEAYNGDFTITLKIN